MTANDGFSFASSRAYGIFLEEIEKHLAAAQACLREGHTPSPEETRRAGVGFHTVKGGAGFFGLHELATVAGELEELLLHAGLDMEQEIDKVRLLLDKLTRLAAQIPRQKT